MPTADPIRWRCHTCGAEYVIATNWKSKTAIEKHVDSQHRHARMEMMLMTASGPALPHTCAANTYRVLA